MKYFRIVNEIFRFYGYTDYSVTSLPNGNVEVVASLSNKYNIEQFFLDHAIIINKTVDYANKSFKIEATLRAPLATLAYLQALKAGRVA